MDTSAIINDLFRIIIIIGFLSIIKLLLVFLNLKLEDSKYQMIIKIISSVVDEVSQTYVKVLKEKGKFDENSQKEALKLSIVKINELLTNDQRSYIDKSYGDRDKWIISQVESHIWNNSKIITKDNPNKIKQMNLFE